MRLKDVSLHHFEAVVQKRVEDIIDSYENSEELLVFVEGPRWATRGFERVAKGWRDFVDSPITCNECVWIEEPLVQESGDHGFTAGIVEMSLTIKGKPKTVRFRGTFVYRKEEDGKWRIIHEHFSQPAADPYGIGDWLKPEQV
jgi:ketosteroid isomerase-like protein